MAKSYAEKLQDPRWQKKRLEILQRDNWKCVKCDCSTKSLHVHHLLYIKGHNPWEYKDKDLETLCLDCHKNEHFKSPEVVYERKYEHLLIQKEIPEIIASIDKHIEELTDTLNGNKESE